MITETYTCSQKQNKLNWLTINTLCFPTNISVFLFATCSGFSKNSSIMFADLSPTWLLWGYFTKPTGVIPDSPWQRWTIITQNSSIMSIFRNLYLCWWFLWRRLPSRSKQRAHAELRWPVYVLWQYQLWLQPDHSSGRGLYQLRHSDV